MVDFPDPLQLLDSSEGQLIQGLDLGLHLRLANIDELYARTSSSLTMAFLTSTLVMASGQLLRNST